MVVFKCLVKTSISNGARKSTTPGSEKEGKTPKGTFTERTVRVQIKFLSHVNLKLLLKNPIKEYFKLVQSFMVSGLFTLKKLFFIFSVSQFQVPSLPK